MKVPLLENKIVTDSLFKAVGSSLEMLTLVQQNNDVTSTAQKKALPSL